MTKNEILLLFSMSGFSFFGLYYFYICLFAKKGRLREIALLISSIGIVFFWILAGFIMPFPIGLPMKLFVSVFGVALVFLLKKGLFGPLIPSISFLKPNNPVVILFIFVIAVYGTFVKSKFTVNPNEQIILTQFGQIIKGPISKPGAYYKVPNMQTIKRFSTLIKDFPKISKDCELANGKHLGIEISGKWKITDAKEYYKNVYDTQRANNLFVKANDTTLCNAFDNITSTENDSLFENLALQKFNEFYIDIKTNFIKYGIEIINIDIKPFGKIELKE